MLDMTAAFLRLAVGFAGVEATSASSAFALTVAAVAMAAVIAVALAGRALPSLSVGTAPHPQRARDVSTQLDQSHPDASGHPRPRAPGFAASAA